MKMMGNMMGVSPDEMFGAAKRMEDGILAMATDMADLKKQIATVLEVLEGMKNDGPTGSGSSGVGGRKRAGSGQLNGGNNPE